MYIVKDSSHYILHSLSNNHIISSRGFRKLFKTLQDCNAVVLVLDLSRTKVGRTAMKELCEFIQNNDTLENLYLGATEIGDDAIKILCEHIDCNVTLKKICFRENFSITDKSFEYFCEIGRRTCVVDIDIRSTSITKPKQIEIQKILSIPTDQRETPIQSTTKSAAKKHPAALIA